METNYLLISKEQFEIGYNYNFTNVVETQYNGSSYTSWSNALRIMKHLFPSFTAEIEKTTYSYDKEGNQNGVILHPRILCLETGKVTPSIIFPVMDNKNNSIAYPNARELTDNEQRAKVKAIANFTGIGLRLWSREQVDLNLADKKGAGNDHPKYRYLLKIHQLIDQVETKSTLPVDFIQPHFGMPLSEIISIGKRLNELANASEPMQEAKVYETWKSPKDMIAWGKEKLQADDDVIKALLENIEPDSTHSKKIPFYNRVLELVN